MLRFVRFIAVVEDEKKNRDFIKLSVDEAEDIIRELERQKKEQEEMEAAIVKH